MRGYLEMENFIHRRLALQLGLSTTIAATTGSLSSWAVAAVRPLIQKRIPSSGELLPVIGLGTNNYSPKTPAERAARRAVLERLTGSGLKVIDTAPAYGESEQVLGELLQELGNRPQVFIATKVTAANGTREEGIAMMEASLQRLKTQSLDLVQVHNLIGADVLMPLLHEWVDKKRVRYIGVTTSRDAQYPVLKKLMQTLPLDFIQVDYSISNRGAAEELLPLAQEKGIAVLINMPFGGRQNSNVFGQVKEKPLPEWAIEIGITTWAQFFLKYVVSHPAVLAAIPGMTRVSNLEDNLGAAYGILPDASVRLKMEQHWDALRSSNV